MDANSPIPIIKGADGLLSRLALASFPTPSPEPEEPPAGRLRRAWNAWTDPEGRELTHRDHGEYMGPWYVSRGWWTGGEQIGLGATAQRDERTDWNGGNPRRVTMYMLTAHVGPVSYHVTVERTR